MTAESHENKSRADIALDMSTVLGEILTRFDHFVRVPASCPKIEIIQCRKVLERLVALQTVGDPDDDLVAGAHT